MHEDCTGKAQIQWTNHYLSVVDDISQVQDEEAIKETGEREFKVPAGESPDGILVLARYAKDLISYKCPGCGSPLVLKKGEIRSPHFAHQSRACCSAETALHFGVKNFIARMLEKCLDGLKRGLPKFKVPCAGNSRFKAFDFHHACQRDAWLSFAELEFDQIAVERFTSDGLKPDVLLLYEGVPTLGIEVVVTHAVDQAKAMRLNHPWIEVKAMQVLQSPRSWKPVQMSHPWSGTCQHCKWANKVNDYEFNDFLEPGDYVAHLSACVFEGHVREWLQSSSKRSRTSVHWRCPWCKKPNQRQLLRSHIKDVGLSSSLIPPCEPEVTLKTYDGQSISVLFGFPKNPNRPKLIVPLRNSPQPILRATPSPKSTQRLILNGTNRPLAFLCKACGRDCLGTIPSPLAPLADWERLSQMPPPRS